MKHRKKQMELMHPRTPESTDRNDRLLLRSEAAWLLPETRRAPNVPRIPKRGIASERLGPGQARPDPPTRLPATTRLMAGGNDDKYEMLWRIEEHPENTFSSARKTPRVPHPSAWRLSSGEGELKSLTSRRYSSTASIATTMVVEKPFIVDQQSG